MNRKQNVIIFSAGETVRNGTVEHIKSKLQSKDVICFDWRELFNKAHDMNNIALLPILSKKIPTFDFALIIAEAVDGVLVRHNQQNAMRDNVIFELGLCIMALGVERVILLAENGIRLPEDLIAVGKIGVEHITFDTLDVNKSIDKVEELIKSKSKVLEEKFAKQLDEIVNHINVNRDIISPVFVGAAVSSAEAYFLNFIVRILENIEKGFSYKRDERKTIYQFPKKLKILVIVPTSIDSIDSSKINEYYKKCNTEKFVIHDATTRDLYFEGIYDEANDSLHIIDVPTSITASYAVVNSVLNIDSDDEYDLFAEERFITKEMDIYAFTLKKLISPNVAKKRLSFLKDKDKMEKIIEMLNNVSVDFHKL